jgi:hypothetical protein
MNRRGILLAAAIAFTIGAAFAAIGWTVAVHGKKVFSTNGQPTWTEVNWPFAPDIWGRGKAFRCNSADCGAEINVYVRPKIGFCNCMAGVSDDAELERLGDLPLLGQKLEPLGPGKAVGIAWMKGLSRNYSAAEPARAGSSAITIAFHDRCDAVVALALVGKKQPDGTEAAVIDLLGSRVVIGWLETTLGL